MKRSQLMMTVASVAGIGVLIFAMLFCIIRNNVRDDSAGDALYREAAAEYGVLTIGVTKTATLSVGSAKQTFDLDLNALGVDDLADEPAVSLQVEEVLVSAGQQVRKGTALFRVTADSALRARRALQQKILETNRECELLEARQKELRLQAAQGYDSEVMDGKYAGVVYSSRCDVLQKRADEAKEAVDCRQEQVNENLLELTRLQQELEKAQKYLRDAQTAVDENYSERYRNAYYYTVYENTRETAQNMVEQLNEQIEVLTKENESLLYEVDQAVRTYHQTIQDLEREKLTAKMERDTRIYTSEMAPERYDIQTVSLDSAMQEAKERYQTALNNIRAFDAYIVQNRVLSGRSGILSDIAVEAGDILNKNDTLVTLHDEAAVTMEIPLCGEDYRAINMDEAVSLSFPECAGKKYEGRVTQISVSSDTCYNVTVTVQGDVSALREGMTGEATFLTDKTQKVLYVPKSAVLTDGSRTYVRVRDHKGRIFEKNVTTGFSDGIHIEITEGLFEGDTVLVAVS